MPFGLSYFFERKEMKKDAKLASETSAILYQKFHKKSSGVYA